MKLKWYGQSCFSLTFANGATVVTDPFDDTVGYPLCRARADVVLRSHDHFDHNHVQSIAGEPQLVTDSAPRTVGGTTTRRARSAAKISSISSKATGCALRIWATWATCPQRKCTRPCAMWT